MTSRPSIPLADVFVDLRVLDFLELTGSQVRAAAALAMHQSTVSRCLQRIGDQFDLLEGPGRGADRYGTNASLSLLREAYRAHRLMRGRLRIGTDLLHQPLLNGLATVEPVPPRFRSQPEWSRLIADGLLDGAVVATGHRRPPETGDQAWLPLGSLRLRLVRASAGRASAGQRCVLVPGRSKAPDLHAQLGQRGWRLEVQPPHCLEADDWLHRCRQQQLALPLVPGLLGAAWVRRQGLQMVDDAPLTEHLWLLLPCPSGPRSPSAAGLLLSALRQRLQARCDREVLATAPVVAPSRLPTPG